MLVCTTGNYRSLARSQLEEAQGHTNVNPTIVLRTLEHVSEILDENTHLEYDEAGFLAEQGD